MSFLTSTMRLTRSQLAAARNAMVRGTLRRELCELGIAATDEVLHGGGELPTIVLADGTRLTGLEPTDSERRLYRLWKGQLPSDLTEEHFRVAVDAVLRYRYPHTMPALTPPGSRRRRSGFHIQHKQTVHDLSLSSATRDELCERFTVRAGEHVVELGCYLGFGAVRVAQMVGLSGGVLVVEAEPRNHGIAALNLEQNRILHGHAVHGAVGGEQFGMPVLLHQSSRQSNSVIDGLVPADDDVLVPATSVDALVAEWGWDSIDLLSLTVNGAEPDGLRGAMRTIERSPSIRIVLAGWYERDGALVHEIVTPFLKELDLCVHVGDLGAVYAWR